MKGSPMAPFEIANLRTETNTAIVRIHERVDAVGKEVSMISGMLKVALPRDGIPSKSDLEKTMDDKLEAHVAKCMKKTPTSIVPHPAPSMSSKQFAALIGALTAFITVASALVGKLIESF